MNTDTIHICDECGEFTKSIHEAADNSTKWEKFIYICDYCWDARIYKVLGISQPPKPKK